MTTVTSKSEFKQTVSPRSSAEAVARPVAHRQEHAKTEILTVVSTGLVGMLAALLLSVFFQPIPQIQDEFAYLLTAETFVEGRLTNATHPHWQHFESMQIIHQPSYNSKYPPGQAIMLALGKLCGRPIVGACIATGISMAALMWMLFGWLPKLKQSGKSCLFCGLLVVSHPGLQIMWGQSFMGGAVALTGGALLLGAVARFHIGPKVSSSILAAIGISLLAVSRPFEGAVLTLCCLSVVVWQLYRDRNWQVAELCKKLIAPVAVVGAVAGSMFLTYNHRVAGNLLSMPYSVHESSYGWNKVFLWQTPADPPEYRHAAMYRFFEDDIATTQKKFGTFGRAAFSQFDTLVEFGLFFFGCSMVIGLAGAPLLLKQPNIKIALALLVPGMITIFVTPWGHSHYFAPFAPLILLFGIGGLLELWKAKDRITMIRRWNWRLVAVLQITWFVIIGFKSLQAERTGWHRQRRAVEHRLLDSPGKDLVFVRYTKEHNVHAEWVYNGANIDDSEIVWAREISPEQDAQFCQYYSDRNIWYVDADDPTVVPKRYQELENSKDQIADSNRRFDSQLVDN